MASAFDRWLTTQPDDESCQECSKPVDYMVLRPDEYCDLFYCHEHVNMRPRGSRVVYVREVTYTCPKCGREPDEHPD